MLKKLLKLNRDYKDAKEKAIEETVQNIESKTNLLFVVLFLALNIYAWLFAIFSLDGFEHLYNIYGYKSLAAFWIISYFNFFQLSKFIFKPTAEELSDDTSYFAIFSACSRKEMRSFISMGLSLLHTAIFFFYLVNKDMSRQ
jgi:hypothetical protein